MYYVLKVLANRWLFVNCYWLLVLNNQIKLSSDLIIWITNSLSLITNNIALKANTQR